MATFNSNSGRRDSYIQLTVNPRAYNISTNSTVVDWSLRVYTGVTYWEGNVQTSNVYIDGGSSLWSASTSNTYAVRTWYNLGSGSKTIPHNSDGTKTISISAAFAVEASGAGIGSVSINTSMALPTIPRASSIGTISGNQIGSEITVNISRATSSFTHYVYYHLPGQSWQNVSTNAGTSSSFTVPVASSSFLPNATSGQLRIMIRTYSGGTRVGGDITKYHTVYVPSSVIPSFSSLSVSEGNASVTSAIGNAYVQSRSSAKLTISGASGIYGSTIKSYRITGHGINTTSSSGTTSTITSSGNITYTATVTDSRGRPASRTATINVLAYTGPRLSGLSYYRSNSSGVQDPLGTSITIKGTVTTSSLKVGGVEKNIVNYQSQTALGSAWTARTTQSYAKTSHAYSATFAGFGVDNSYNVRSRAGDIFTWGSWSAGIIPTGEVTQQWSRKTTSFGKMIDNSNYNIQAGSGGIHSEGPIAAGKGIKSPYGRPSSSNLPIIGDNTVKHFLSTSSMSEGRPGADGFITHYEWDNTGGWSSQLYMPNSAGGTIKFRAMSSGVWGSWESMSIEGHTHSAGEITSGTIADARLPAKAKPTDFVVAQGSNYKKWNSGDVEIWGRATGNSIVASYATCSANLPIALSTVSGALLSGTVAGPISGQPAGIYNSTMNSTSKVTFSLWKLTAGNFAAGSNNVTVDYYIRGRWK